MYDSGIKAKWDYENSIAFAEEKGFEKGDYKKALDVATKLIKENSSIEFIARITKLSIEEIERLQKSIR